MNEKTGNILFAILLLFMGMIIGYFITRNIYTSIESKQLIKPEIHYYIKNNKVDSMYVYKIKEWKNVTNTWKNGQRVLH